MSTTVALDHDRAIDIALLRIEMAAAFGLDVKSEKVCAGVEGLYARGYRPPPSLRDPRNRRVC